MRRIILVCLIAGLPLSTEAQKTKAPPVQDQMESLRAALEGVAASQAAAGAAANSPDGFAVMASELSEFSSSFASLQSQIQSEKYPEAIRMLQRWISRTKNEAIKKTLQTLLSELEKEQKARVAKADAEIEAMIKNARSKLLAAKSPGEIAALREEFDAYRNLANSTNQRLTASQLDKLSRVTSFLSTWQRVVAFEAAGNYSRALSSVRDAQYNDAWVILDAKALETKTQELINGLLAEEEKDAPQSPFRKAIASILEQVKTPADAAAAAQKLRLLSPIAVDGDSQMLNSLTQSLQRVARLYHDFSDGAYGRVLNSQSYDSLSPYDAQLDNLETGLKVKAIAAANDLKTLGEPKPGEGIGTFVRRRAQDAFKNKEWEMLDVLLNVYPKVAGGGCAHNESMKTAVGAFLAGQQLEKAGQFGDAVSAYSLCLAQSGPLVPRKEATEAIERLRKEHADAFDPTGNLDVQMR